MQKVRFDTIDHTAHVTLNRPEARNAFDPQMINELTDVFRNINRNHSLRVVVLSGEGKSFCAGADLQWMQSMANYSLEENRADAQGLHEMFATIHACELPVIGRVQGHAMGGALGLLAVCDVVSAELETQFCFSEVKLGLIPAVISPFVLAKANRGHVQRFMITGETFSAAQAEAIGLVHHLGTLAQSSKFVSQLVVALHLNGPEAMRKTKSLVQKVSELGLGDESSSLTIDSIAKQRVGNEGQEGLKSFIAKKDPSWRVKL